MFNIFNKQKGTGALIDNRPMEERIKDFTFEEIVANVNPVKWEEKKNWNKYPIFDQNGSGSCVAQSVAKMLGIMYQNLNGDYVHFSATDVYQRRSNKPQGGMIGKEALSFATKGVTLEALVPSQKMTDRQMDSIVIAEYKKKVGEIFKVENYVTVGIQDIDTIASIIQTTGKPVMVWFYFNHDEWTKNPTVKRQLNAYADSTSRHSVTAVDFLLINGKKHLVIDDSWGTSYGEKGQRFISEDFFRERNFFAGYLLNFKFAEETSPEKLNPLTQTLRFGMTNDEVAVLQTMLRSAGLFPNNQQIARYFGAITDRAIKQFQTKHNLLPDGIVGAKTREVLNKLYGII